MNDITDLFGPPISVYTRAQALEDGALVDVSTLARDFGIRWPVAMTHGAWVECVQWDEEINARKGTAQDETGRACDVLAMAAWCMRRGGGESRGTFYVLRTPREGKGRKARSVELHLHCGPGDTPEPVITIMLPGED
jgi:hypothetical protein